MKLADQDYPAELVDIFVVDGGSSDATREIVRRLAGDGGRIRLLDNPRVNQAAGLNVGIRESAGQIMARLDGHAAWPPAHLRRCAELLRRWDADNVGGTMDNQGQTLLGGGARYRYGRVEMETDTVFLGCFRRSALERVGGFDETAAPHEDYELNSRIRETGGRVVFSPDLPTKYYTRPTWRKLARQYFRYGQAKARVARRSPVVLRPYHLVPPAVVAIAVGLAGGVALGRARRISLLGALGYAAAAGCFGWRASRGEEVRVRAIVPAVFPVLHGAWGFGFWRGLIVRPGPGPQHPGDLQAHSITYIR